MNRNQYLYHDDHEAIISRDDFIAAQHLIANAKYGYRGLLPRLHVVETGALRGFVAVNTKWSSFTADDYLEAARTVLVDNTEDSITAEKHVQPGDFDFRGCVVVRSQFIQTHCDLSVTFSETSMQFSKGCITKLDDTQRIELLFDPIHQVLAIRPSTAENRHSVIWMKPSDRSPMTRPISGTAFLPMFYSMLGWKQENRYRVRGIRRQRDNETVLLFYLRDTEIMIPVQPEQTMFDENTKPVSQRSPSSVIAYPANWANSFGTDVYAHGLTPELIPIDQKDQRDFLAPGTPVEGRTNLSPTPRNDLKSGIDVLLQSMKKEAVANG